MEIGSSVYFSEATKKSIANSDTVKKEKKLNYKIQIINQNLE